MFLDTDAGNNILIPQKSLKDTHGSALSKVVNHPANEQKVNTRNKGTSTNSSILGIVICLLLTAFIVVFFVYRRKASGSKHLDDNIKPKEEYEMKRTSVQGEKSNVSFDNKGNSRLCHSEGVINPSYNGEIR